MGQDDPLTSDRSSARGLTKVWEELALEEEWAARLCGVRVPINPKFGSGEKTRRELRVKALPDIELDDTDEGVGGTSSGVRPLRASSSGRVAKRLKTRTNDEVKRRRRNKKRIDRYLLKNSTSLLI